jgi:hypothetical protein
VKSEKFLNVKATLEKYINVRISRIEINSVSN